jgi:hypothetical protein
MTQKSVTRAAEVSRHNPKEIDMLQGYKTYIVAAMVAAIALIEGLGGIDIPGANVQSDWFTYILAALGLGALRSAFPAK